MLATDLEGHTVTYSLTPAISFITLSATPTVDLNPTLPSDCGVYTFSVIASDSSMPTTSSSITINVSSQPPKFSGGSTFLTSITKTPINSPLSLNFDSAIVDPEGGAVTVTVTDVSFGIT